MSINKIIVPGLILGGTYAYYKYNQFEDFKKRASYYIEALNIVPGSLVSSNYSSVKFLLKIKIENPTSFSIELKKIEIGIYFNGLKIGDIYSLEPVKIKGNMYSILKNEIKLDLKKLPQNIILAINESVNQGKIKLDFKTTFYSYWGTFENTTKQVFEI